MNVGHSYILPESNVPSVVSGVHNFRIDMKLERFSKCAKNPEACHEDNDVVT